MNHQRNGVKAGYWDVICRKADGLCPDWQDSSVVPIRRNLSMVPPYGLTNAPYSVKIWRNTAYAYCALCGLNSSDAGSVGTIICASCRNNDMRRLVTAMRQPTSM